MTLRNMQGLFVYLFIEHLKFIHPLGTKAAYDVGRRADDKERRDLDTIAAPSNADFPSLSLTF